MSTITVLFYIGQIVLEVQLALFVYSWSFLWVYWFVWSKKKCFDIASFKK